MLRPLKKSSISQRIQKFFMEYFNFGAQQRLNSFRCVSVGAISCLRSTDLIRIINFQHCFGARRLLLARKLLSLQVLKVFVITRNFCLDLLAHSRSYEPQSRSTELQRTDDSICKCHNDHYKASFLFGIYYGEHCVVDDWIHYPIYAMTKYHAVNAVVQNFSLSHIIFVLNYELT